MAFAITFRGKVQSCKYTDGTLASRYIRVPKLTKSHADMTAARKSAKWGGLANSDLFPQILNRLALESGCKVVGEGMRIDLLKPLSDRIKVDESGFLATVTITIDE